MLMIIGTPIGNVEDITVRATNYLKDADLIACEDTRSTKKLLRLLNIKTNGKLISYHDHNGASVRPYLIEELKKGKSIALVSDAGTPLISDPGYKLVESCHKNNIRVSAIPGPTSPIVALTVSGLPTDKFTFNGYIPSAVNNSRKALVETKNLQTTQIWFSTPPKLINHLKTMLSVYGNRRIVIAREMTKLHEEVKNAPLNELLLHYETNGPPKGEIVIVVAGANNNVKKNDLPDVVSLLRDALGRLSLRDAVNEVSILTGASKKHIYQNALDIINNKTEHK